TFADVNEHLFCHALIEGQGARGKGQERKQTLSIPCPLPLAPGPCLQNASGMILRVSSRKKCITCRSLSKLITLRATSRACSMVLFQLLFSSAGSRRLFIRNVSNPKPNNNRLYGGPPAISPQTEHPTPPRPAARITSRISIKTDGWAGQNSPATFSLVRSTA